MFARFAPVWVYAGAFSLAAIAGATNAVAWLGSQHKGITHVTGALTEASTRAASLNLMSVLHSLAVVGAFLVGAIVSGLLVHDGAIKLGRRYGVGLLLEALLLCLAYVVRDHRGAAVSDYLAASACGLQNALATSFSGTVLRTTHMTGVVTDLGLLLGHAMRKKKVEWGKLWIYLCLLSGFSVGGIVGAFGSTHVGPAALLLPASAAAFLGVVYIVWLHGHRSNV